MNFLIEAPSHYINVINFIIFEVVLITAIFFLTADVSGRLNFLSLISGEDKKLVVISPPILGGGICSTSFPRAICMLLVRGLGVFLIFGTALTIDGETKEFIKEHSATVRVPARITDSISRQVFRQAISNRTSCQVFNSGFIYHGLLYSNSRCEYNIKLDVVKKQIRYSSDSELVSLKADTCKVSNKTNDENLFFETLKCSNAVIFCIHLSKIDFPKEKKLQKWQNHPNWCRGILYAEKHEYICSAFESREDMIWTGQCRRSFNVRTVKDYWLRSPYVSDAEIIDVIGGISVLGEEKKNVQFIKMESVTTVNKIWGGILALKVLIVVSLLCISIVLKRKGAKCVMNDENCLAHLLRSSVREAFGMSHDDFKLYVHYAKVDQSVHFWPSKVPQKKEDNTRIHDLESIHW